MEFHDRPSADDNKNPAPKIRKRLLDVSHMTPCMLLRPEVCVLHPEGVPNRSYESGPKAKMTEGLAAKIGFPPNVPDRTDVQVIASVDV